MASQDWFDKDFYKVLGVSKDVTRRGPEEDLPQARAQVPPRLQPGRRRGRGEVQGDQRGALGALRPRAAQGVRRDPRHGLRRALHRARRRRRRGRLRGRLRRHVRRPGRRRPAVHVPAGRRLRRPARRHVRRRPASASRAAATAASAVRSRGRDVTASTTLDFITATKGEQITLQTADGKPITVKHPGGRRRRPEDQAARQGPAVARRRRARRPRAHRARCASTRCSSATG